MKILIASTPATGHLNPMLAITQILRGDGHEIAGSGSVNEREVTASERDLSRRRAFSEQARARADEFCRFDRLGHV